MRRPDELLSDLDDLQLSACLLEAGTLKLQRATAAAHALLGDPSGWLDALHPEDRQWLAEGQAGTRTVRILRPPDSWRMLRVDVRRAGDSLLTLVAELAPGHLAGRSRLDALIENLPFDYFEIDRHGVFTRVNSHARKTWGDNTGKRVSEVTSSDENRRRWEVHIARATAGEAVREEYDFDSRGQRWSTVLLMAPVPDGGIVGLNIDVTARRQAEARSKELVVELQRSLEQLDRAQEQLVTRERLAALGELAAVVAHEVRNPLGAIFNAVTGLRKEKPTEQSELLLGIIDEEASRLDAMVRNLLSYARPIHPQLHPEPLGPVLQEALAGTIRALGAGGEVTSDIEVDPGLGPVPFDAQLLRMALTNIYTNAIQAMPRGGRIRIVAAPEEHDGKRWAEIRIRDSGSGISPENLPRIFEPFFTSRAAGTGLGLAVVRRIMDAHHGSVVALSEPGEGSTFALYLPR